MRKTILLSSFAVMTYLAVSSVSCGSSSGGTGGTAGSGGTTGSATGGSAGTKGTGAGGSKGTGTGGTKGSGTGGSAGTGTGGSAGSGTGGSAGSGTGGSAGTGTGGTAGSGDAGKDSGGDSGCSGTLLKVKNYLAWCSVTVGSGAASVATEQTVCEPAGTVNLKATPIPGFMDGTWHDTTTAKGGTATVVEPGVSCVWVCCPGTGLPCPTTDQCP